MVKDIREAWRAAVHGTAKSQTQLSDGTTTHGEEKGFERRAVPPKSWILSAGHRNHAGVPGSGGRRNCRTSGLSNHSRVPGQQGAGRQQ